MKNIHLLTVLTLLMSVFCTAAIANTWTNGSGNNLWTTGSNWNGGVPDSGDSAEISEITPDQCVIQSGDNAVCSTMNIGTSSSNPGYLVMTGGNLSTNGWFKVGRDSYNVGGNVSTFTMSGGTVYVPSKYFTIAETDNTAGNVELSGDAYIYGPSRTNIGNHNDSGTNTAVGTMTLSGNAYYSSSNVNVGNNDYAYGTLTMLGGEFVSTSGFTIARTSSSTGRVYLNGGTISCLSFSMGSDAYMNIEDGTLVVSGDATGTINGYVTANKIQAFNGSVPVDVFLDGGQTIVQASSGAIGQAFGEYPSSGSSNIAPDVTLTWSAGNYAVSPNIS